MRRFAMFIGTLSLVAACGGAPDIGHTVSQTADSHCLTCHLTGVDEAPATPHPQNAGCVDCHGPGGTKDVGASAWPGP